MTATAERSAVSSFLWAGFAFGTSKLATFVATLVLARLLVPEHFGVVAAAMAVIALIEIGLDLGVGSAVVYEQEEGITRRVQTAFTVNLLVAIVLTAAFVLAAPAIAGFFRVPDEDGVFRAIGLYLLIRALGQVHDAVLRRDLDFRRRAVAEAARAVTRLLVSVGLALSGLGVWALVIGLLAGETAGTVVNWLLVRLRPAFTLDRTAAGALLRFGVAIVAVQTVAVASSNADYLVVGRVLGPQELGYYTMAYRLPELLIENLYWIFSSIALPWYSRARRAGAEGFAGSMLTALRLLTLFGFPTGIGLALVARDAVPVLLSQQWAPAVPATALLALAAGVHAIGFASGDIFPALGRPGLLLRLDVAFAVTELAAFLALVRHGITAVAAVHIVSAVLYTAVRLVVANRLVGTSWRDSARAMMPALAVSVGVLALALPVRLVMDPGAGALAATVAAGLAGGAVGLAVAGRSTAREVLEVLRRARS
ncbi:oligosaccharide flippase family protein [Kineosporiaceae bacterium SCSIO 59966]|nr:oligosaccharide flippase family protein [Kineosporiaceae bacterium SCSIO 59966]